MSAAMRLPTFLIVGAMKAGTTTLHRDLSMHPDVFLPERKEPNALASDAVLSGRALKRYASLFAPAGNRRHRGEASTAYTKMPAVPGVPARAKRLLGPGLRIIYLVRDPIKRLASHHYHDYGSGAVEADVNTALLRHPEYVDYGRYAYQIEPWIEAFGRSNVGIWRFEDYIADRAGVVNQMCTFLGLPPCPVSLIDGLALNVSSEKPVATALWRKLVIENPLYSRVIRPRVPWQTRAMLARHLLPKAPPPPLPLNAESEQAVRMRLEADMERLRVLMGLDHPVWSLRAEPAPDVRQREQA